MASYIPNITDNTQQIPVAATLPQSNYQFLQTQMDKANAMYESGLQEVKSGYASIVNQAVTGAEMNERKQRYIQQAQNKLRTLSSKDLSLPQNVAQAETAYAPFWEDDLLLQNAAETKKQAKANSQLDSWLYSTDEDTRKLYSDHNRAAIQKAQNILANTPATKEAYAKMMLDMQEARAIPYYDINKDIEDSFIHQFGTGVDKGVGYTITEGAGMLTAYNGPKSFDAFKTWYISQLGEKYAPQLRQQAWVEVQNRRDQVMRDNPTITDPAQVDRLLAKDRMKEMQAAYTSNINSYTNLIEDFSKRINDLDIHKAARGGKLSPSEQMEYTYMKDQMQGYIQLRSNLQIESQNYTELIDGKANENYFKTLTDIGSNPVGYISKIKVNEMASTWAKGRSSITGPPKIEVNPIVEKEHQWLKEDREFSVSQANLRIETAKLQLKAQELDDQLLINTGIKNRFTGERDSRYGNKGWMGNEVTATGLPAGIGDNIADETTQVDHLQKYIKVQQDLQRPLDEAIQQTLDIQSPTGFGTTVLGEHGVGLNDAEMNEFSRYMKNLYRDNKTIPTDKEKLALDKVVSAMLKEGTISSSSSIKGAISLQNALMEYGNTKVANGLAGLKADEVQTIRREFAKHRDNIKQSTTQYLAGKQKFDKEVLEKASKDARFNRLLVDDGTGKRMLEEKDIEQTLPKEIQVINKTTGQKEVLKREDISRAYLSGDYDIDASNLNRMDVLDWNDTAVKLKLAGQQYEVIADNIDDALKLRDASDNLKRRFGESKSVNTLRSRLVGELSASAKYNNGILYKGLNLDPNDADKDKAEFTRGKIKQLAPIGNTTRFHMYESGSNTPTYLTDTKNGAGTVEEMRSILASDDEQKKWIANVDFVPEAGKVAITFKTDPTKAKQPSYAGKTVWMESTPTMRQQLMSWVPNTTISGPLVSVTEGSTYSSPTSLATDGYEGSITPIDSGPDNKPTAVIINIRYKDPNTGAIQKVREPVYLTGPNARSMSDVWNKYQDITTKIGANQQIASRVATQKVAASSPSK